MAEHLADLRNVDEDSEFDGLLCLLYLFELEYTSEELLQERLTRGGGGWVKLWRTGALVLL